MFGGSFQVFGSGGITVTRLVDAFGNVNVGQLLELLKKRNRSGNTPLHLAVGSGPTGAAFFGKVAEFILSENWLDQLLDQAKDQPIGQQGQLFEYPLQQLLELLKERDRSGNTPLHLAAMSGPTGTAFLVKVAECVSQEQLLKLLVEQDQFGNTPLHWAARNDDPDATFFEKLTRILSREQLLGLLIKRSQLGLRPLHVTAVCGPIEAVFFGKVTEFILQDQKLGPSQLNILLKQQTQRGNTPFHLAAMSGPTGVTFLRKVAGCVSQEQLLELLKEQNSQGNTPLHLAAGDRNAIEFATNVSELLPPNQLIELLNIKNHRRSYTPFHIAAISNETSLFPQTFTSKLSAQQFAELFACVNESGRSPLQVASFEGNDMFLIVARFLTNSTNTPSQ
jgi:ankyrin repeat protein